jgi:predicted DNA binding protein
MTVIATFSLPAEEFTLGQAFQAVEGGRIDLERLVPLGDAAVPYFWIDSEAIESAKTALPAHPAVEDVLVLDTLEDRALLRIDWTEQVDGVLEAIAENEGVLLEAASNGDEWTLQLRFPDHEHLSACYRQCMASGKSIDLAAVHDRVTDQGAINNRLGLTSAQHEALVTAIETGYFAVPREISLAELGEKLGISDAALSERLRRGEATLIATTLLTAPAAKSTPVKEL